MKAMASAVTAAAAASAASAAAGSTGAQPRHWRTVLQNIRLMRQKRDAPVDTMGTEALPDPTQPPKIRRFHALVAVLLSSQTKDEQTSAAVRRLQALPGGLTPQNILALSDAQLEDTLRGVGFHRRKTQYLKNSAKILIDTYGGDIPATIKDLCALPGIGIKMATICMAVAWNEVTGIAVDVHVHRIANRLGWAHTASKPPEQTQKELEAWMPRDLWGEINLLLVGFGQQICKPVRPLCHNCLNRDVCPASLAPTTGKAAAVEEPVPTDVPSPPSDTDEGLTAVASTKAKKSKIGKGLRSKPASVDDADADATSSVVGRRAAVKSSAPVQVSSSELDDILAHSTRSKRTKRSIHLTP